MATNSRGPFSKQLAPGYMRVVFNSYKRRPMEGAMLTNQKTSTRAYEEDFPVAGFGSMYRKPEGSSVIFQTLIEGAVKRYMWDTFALGYRITEEMFDDQLYGVFGAKMSAALGVSAAQNEEVVRHSPFNNAFTASAPYLGWDGKPLCSTTHVLLRTGANVSNTATADFGLLAYQAALEHFHGLVDESGFPVMYIPKRIIHGTNDMWAVKQVIGSSQLPGTNQNDINSVQGTTTAHHSHYLVDTDAWFVQADVHDVNYFRRKAFAFRSGDDFNSFDALFAGSQRHGSGHGDWRGIYGSPGA